MTRSEKNAIWNEKNPNKVREYKKRYREKNRDKLREQNSNYKKQHRKKKTPMTQVERNRKYRELNKEKVAEYQKSYKRKRVLKQLCVVLTRIAHGGDDNGSRIESRIGTRTREDGFTEGCRKAIS